MRHGRETPRALLACITCVLLALVTPLQADARSINRIQHSPTAAIDAAAHSPHLRSSGLIRSDNVRVDPVTDCGLKELALQYATKLQGKFQPAVPSLVHDALELGHTCGTRPPRKENEQEYSRFFPSQLKWKRKAEQQRKAKTEAGGMTLFVSTNGEATADKAYSSAVEGRGTRKNLLKLVLCCVFLLLRHGLQRWQLLVATGDAATGAPAHPLQPTCQRANRAAGQTAGHDLLSRRNVLLSRPGRIECTRFIHHARRMERYDSNHTTVTAWCAIMCFGRFLIVSASPLGLCSILQTRRLFSPAASI